ncbi:MAG: protease HtpX, partial [Deltaproteobacteria bacterium]|nr:protease HtpX [Deltaproteobacteria bacterium]
MNHFKTFLLMLVLTGLFILVGTAIGGKTGAIYAFAFAALMNFVTYWFSDKIVLRMYGAKEVTQQEASTLHGIVSELTSKASMPMPKVYIMENETPNAFATGRNPEHAAVAVTTGLMGILSKEELAGVIGHELSHIKHRDIPSTIAATIAGAIGMLASMARWGAIFGGGRSDDEEGGGGGANFLFVFLATMVASIAAMLIQMAISRSREYLADAGGAHLSHPLSLSKALGKLDMAAHRIPMEANPSTAHMFIVNPLSGGRVLSLFSTHPPIEERIARLEEK